ncbi:Zinc-binding protein AdcA [Marine Group I thaumarchaeote SCGC AAA799-E16]|uniref:Zinc-binding protein AdcA n=3 Tax=Marine Group I TaxID=905826 RepID=A0A087RN19_9ARCH|nr:Zinc-binding protein AdcA [Marine Group I thaumarchaeote SCGC AAA799-E16]KFM14873.1 Zinc-binding protein AdcA [Marine Group I thaumarchaeote SCGC AAA799-D11]KFM17642.1 Zinc-binding lipoprotein AdcA [Marine Group I thaumarchaeote SCGC RSA3]
MNSQSKMAIIAITVVIPLAIFVIYGTDSSRNLESVDNSKLKVVSSFYPLLEFSQNIGQEKIDATLLTPVGVEPHDWEPTIKDVQRMESSDLIIINGIGFETWVESLEENNFSGTIVDTSNGILIKTIDESDEEHEEESEEDSHDEHALGDPHIWLNPVLAKIQVQNIANAFSNSDPENRDFYQTNAAAYIKQLDSLDSKIRTELSSCTNDFIAFHDAFSYFADEYGLTQHTILSSNDPHGDVSARTLEKVISEARNLNIKVIFSEEAVNQKTSEIIANEIGGKVLLLSPLEVVEDGTYISKMKNNLENLKEALC